MKRSFTISIILVGMIIHASAQIIHVPGDQPSIQAGIDAATDGDTVLVADSTYFDNINFRGKPITVASHFILDGDEAHIPATIIDGSQASNPDSASTVVMISGEDTTSVLMGFTIKGGNGTNHDEDGFSERGGGGVYINGSGGKIIYNLIRGNHLQGGDRIWQYGGGIFAYVFNNHTLIVRENKIYSNNVTGVHCCGGGFTFMGGKVICEYNEISNNTLDAQIWILGGGIAQFAFYKPSVIREAIIRNNLISGNKSQSSNVDGGGGGIAISEKFKDKKTAVYNNIIADNITDGYGGAIFTGYNVRAAIFNNTIVGNESNLAGHSLAIGGGADALLFNNIIGSSVDNQLADILLGENEFIQFNNNMLKEPLDPKDFLTTMDNIYEEPLFETDSYELAELSPGIGQGVESVEIEGTLYAAPLFDYKGNTRPNPIDQSVDIGAIESPYAYPVNNIHGFKSSGEMLYNVYPNPVSEILTIEAKVEGIHEISVNSPNGQMIYLGKIEGSLHQIDLSTYKKGVFFVTIKSQDFITTKKIIKL